MRTRINLSGYNITRSSNPFTRPQTPSNSRLPLYLVKRRSWFLKWYILIYLSTSGKYLNSSSNTFRDRTLLIRKIGISGGVSLGLDETPLRSSLRISSNLAQHHPSGSSGKSVLSTGSGSSYLSCQFFGGFWPLASYLASSACSQRRRRSVRMR